MEKEKRKKMMLLVGSIVIAVMFVTSYAAFGTNGTPSSTTTTIKQNIYPVFGNANAVVTGYGSTMTIFASNNSTATKAGNLLTKLESNGSISNYLTAGNEFIIYASGITAYALQGTLYNSIPGNSITINATEKVRLPASMTLYYYGRPIPTYPSNLNFTISVPVLKQVGTNLTVNVHALVFQNGQVYSNNIQVTGG